MFTTYLDSTSLISLIWISILYENKVLSAAMLHFHWREKILFSRPSIGCKKILEKNTIYLIPWKVMNKSLANKNLNAKKW